MTAELWSKGDVLEVRDIHGIRRVRVELIAEDGRCAVRNMETNRLSYVRPGDPRIKRIPLEEVA